MNDKTKLGLGVLGAAAVLGVLGDLLLRATPWGLNVLLWVTALVGLAAALMILGGVDVRGEGRWLAVPTVFFAALFVWRDSDMLAVVNGLAFGTALSLAALRSRSGRIMLAGLADYFYWGVQSALFAFAGVLPTTIRDIQWRELRSGSYAPLLAVMRGLAVATPLLLVFGALFVAADAVFEGLVVELFDFDLATVFGHLLLFSFVAWVSAGLLGVAVVGGELPPAPERPAFLRLGLVEIGIVLGLLDVLFLAFVLVQVRYFFGGAEQVLGPDGLTYAEYARRGFFELVTVTALALPILLLAHWLLRSEKSWHLRLFRGFAGVLICLLFVVMASALQRMRLYTAEFGLTELRFYTTAFMLWMFAVLLWFILTVLRDRRDRFAFGALISGFLAVASLNAINPDDVTVRANVERYEAGKKLDAAYLASLSADAVPALMDSLAKIGDRRLHEEDYSLDPDMDRPSAGGPTLEAAVKDRWQATDSDWRTFNISRYRAHALVDSEPYKTANTRLKTSYPQYVVDKVP